MALIARARKKRKPVAEMNVVPYIDVMLVLLVIFMVTAPMLNQGVKVDLPKVSSEALPQDNNTQVLTISIKADKTYFWNLGSEVDTEKQMDKAMTLPQMTDAVAFLRTAKEWTEASAHPEVFLYDAVPMRLARRAGYQLASKLSNSAVTST